MSMFVCAYVCVISIKWALKCDLHGMHPDNHNVLFISLLTIKIYKDNTVNAVYYFILHIC